MHRIPSNTSGKDCTAEPQPTASAYALPEPVPTGSFSSLHHANEEHIEQGSSDNMLDSSNKSAAPTFEPAPGTVHSDAAHSKSGTTLPGGAGMSSHSGGGSNSVFSSSNHSSRSLTTTLTTIQSTAPSAHLQNTSHTAAQQAAVGAAHGHQSQPSHSSSIYFQHQYPTTPVASAVPAHVSNPSSTYTPSHLPTTYRSATANNLLTDNASILTLASSSQQANRRNSLDTTASVRAIAPSSQWGGSRESLPLSMISQSADAPTGSSGSHGHGSASQRPSIGGLPSQERASIYSSQGNAPVLSSERNSIYTGRTGTAGGASIHNTVSDNASFKERGADERGSLKADDRSSFRAADGGSVKSGLGGVGHGRNDSIANSIGGSIGQTGVTGGSGPGTGVANNSPVMASSKELD